MPGTHPRSLPDSTDNLPGPSPGVENGRMLFPGETNHDVELVLGGQIQQPSRRRRVCPYGVESGSGDGFELALTRSRVPYSRGESASAKGPYVTPLTKSFRPPTVRNLPSS